MPGGWQALFVRIDQVLQQRGTPAEIGSRILEALGQATGWAYAAIWSADPGTPLLRRLATWTDPFVSFPEFERQASQGTFVPGAALARKVFESGQPIWVSDVSREPNLVRSPAASLESLHTAFCCPIRSGGRAIGALELYAQEVREENENLLLLGQLLGTQLGFVLERGQLLGALGASETRFREIFENAPIGMAHVGLDGRWLWVNPKFAEILGYSPDELLQRRFQDLTDPKDLDGSLARLQDLLAGKTRSYTREKRYVRKDGSHVWVSLTTTLVHNLEGKAKYRLQIIEDISTRKRAERQVAWLVQATPDALLIVDAGGRIRDMNGQTTQLFGYTRESLLGLPLEALVPVRFREGHRVHRREYAVAPRPRAMGLGMDLYALRQDGTEIPVEISLNPLQTEEGLLTAASIRDVTGDRDLKRQLLHAQKMEAIALFAGGIAHDFNNQLTAMLGYSELMLSQIGPDKPIWADLQEIRKAAERSAALTRQLLAFTRQQVLNVETVIANDVVRETEKMLRRVIGEDVRLEFSLCPALRPIKADVSQFEQIVTNLAVNARDAMPGGGTLTVGTANIDVDRAYTASHAPMVPGPYVMLTVSDTGSGMDRETKARIFEPFFTTKARHKGTGLGLSTVFGIVKQLHGFIWVDSEPGRGTTFTIHFPVTEELPRVRERVNLQPAALSGTETILLVEDDEDVRRLAVTVLKRHGYKVLEAATPHEALALLRRPSQAIHLLLTDVVMPEMTGPELVARLSPNQQFKVLYTSGYSDPERFGDDFLASEDFLEKPFSASQLLRKVQEVLTASDAGQGK